MLEKAKTFPKDKINMPLETENSTPRAQKAIQFRDSKFESLNFHFFFIGTSMTKFRKKNDFFPLTKKINQSKIGIALVASRCGRGNVSAKIHSPAHGATIIKVICKATVFGSFCASSAVSNGNHRRFIKKHQKSPYLPT